MAPHRKPRSEKNKVKMSKNWQQRRPGHMGNIGEVLPVQNGGSGHNVGTTAGYNGQEKERKTHNERFPRAADTVQVVLQSATTVGGPGNPHQVWPAVRSCPWPSSPRGGPHPTQNGGASERVADTYLRE